LARSAIEVSADNLSIPIKVSFKDLNYRVYKKKEEKPLELLKKATGYLLPGQTHYIMGPSGAGKTTLLNAISGRL